MMFIIRCDAGTPLLAEVQVKASRQTPEVVRAARDVIGFTRQKMSGAWPSCVGRQS
jgi:hypothetical protein